MNVILFHTALVLDLIFFILGIITFFLYSGSRTFDKVFGIISGISGAAILSILIFNLCSLTLVGTGIDLLLSYFAGVSAAYSFAVLFYQK